MLVPIVVIAVFLVIQLSSFTKLVNEEFESMENYTKNIQKFQSNEKLVKFKKNLMYQSGLMILILAVYSILTQV